MNSERMKTFGIGAVVVLAIGVLGWVTWSSFLGEGGTAEADLTQELLCSNPRCAYFGRESLSNLQVQDRVAAFPSRGPGYKCPKCQQFTLYPNPMVCQKCKRPFLVTPEYSGKCPKCGAQQ